MDRLKPVRTARGCFTALVLVGGLIAGVSGIADAQATTLGTPARRGTPAQQSAGFINRVFRDASGEHKYVLYLPPNYSPDVRWPVILYLHGAGERGNDGTMQTTVGLGPFVKARRDDFPYLVVFPQCEDTQVPILQAWSPTSADGKRALAILAQVEHDYAIDSHRCILTGWSMGGYGTWSLGAADPSHWAALVPVSGGGDPASASRLANVPIWAFAGANDQVVPARDTEKMVAAVRAAGGHPWLTVVPDAGHDVWKNAYNDSALYVWLMNPKQAPTGATAGTSPASTAGEAPSFSATPGARSPAAANLEGPFVPALAIPNAISVRLGNDALRAIAYSAPKMIAPDALTGSINDIYTSTEASGYYFSVQFSRISYAGQLDRAYIKAFASDHLNVQLAVRATMTIGATYVSGAGRSAYAGPISVVIGNRYPVWLGMDVTPYVDGDKLRLRYNAARFEIPYDDWYVSAPYGVSTQGLGMTSDRVSSGLVEGIYGQKARIEQEVQSIVPFLLSKVEERLDLSEVSQVANAFWPLPVYRPRLQVFPQSVSTDDKGISVLMGVTAAAIDPRKAPAKPVVERSAGVELSAVGTGSELNVGVAPDVLQPLTKMLIDGDVARINVLDIPEKSFAAFADRKALSQVLPDLAAAPADTQIWAELRLASPISIRDGGSATSSEAQPAVAQKKSSDQKKNSDEVRITAMKANSPDAAAKSAAGSDSASGSPPAATRPFEFVVPKAVISVAIKENPSASNWTPYAEFDVDLVQRATATMLHRGFSERALRIDWAGEPEVKATAHFAPGAAPKNSDIQTDKLREMFVAAWRNWTHNGPASQVPVSDVDFQYAKLRLDGVNWSPPVLSVLFDEPGIKITNSSNAPLIYETKDLYSPWSSEITLAPGKSHEFKVSEPLLYRRVVNGEFAQTYTLPVGLQYEFRSLPTGGQPNLYRVREPGAGH
ncbi:MAG TPA: dienelactone hydrolase family protein [Planctomycetaceae bacterium]|nr:dienelactone hydrolase family protein [Planctomycetaceae bacterium]